MPKFQYETRVRGGKNGRNRSENDRTAISLLSKKI
mgnify:CR=1 FL=1|jgi:hypothetical protein